MSVLAGLIFRCGMTRCAVARIRMTFLALEMTK